VADLPRKRPAQLRAVGRPVASAARLQTASTNLLRTATATGDLLQPAGSRAISGGALQMAPDWQACAPPKGSDGRGALTLVWLRQSDVQERLQPRLNVVCNGC